MVDRIIELARALAKQAGNDVANELLDLIGEDGEPHPRNARHPSGDTGVKFTPHSREHAGIMHEIPANSAKLPYDVCYKAGVGFYVSDLELGNWAYYHDKKHTGPGNPEVKYGKYKFISEETVIGLAAEINARRSMTSATNDFIKESTKAAAKNHPGTDAQDTAKDGYHSASDDGCNRVDHSESTIYIGQTESTGTFLNGSAVKHRRFVHIGVRGPDGNEIVDVGLTMEQFAAALTSRSQIPCTLHSYWSVSRDSVRLVERVRTPPSMMDRMRGRIDGRMDEQMKRVHEVMDALSKAAATGKPINKTAAASLASDLETALSNSKANAAFAAEQAVEEVSSVVESAVMHLGQTHGIGLDRIADTPEITHALTGVLKLPAPAAQEKKS